MMPRKRWDDGASPAEMLSFLQMKLTVRGARPERNRKVRLYLVALCRQVWDEMPWVCRTLAEIAERQADGAFEPSLPREPLSWLASQVWGCARNNEGLARSDPSWLFPPAELAHWEADLVPFGYTKPPGADDHLGALSAARFTELARLITTLSREARLDAVPKFHSVPLLRDVAGDPYSPVKFKPAWQTGTVVALARHMYESRDFSAMPILADALQDAGCNNDAVLAHCREQSVHTRGCWVVDLILGKE